MKTIKVTFSDGNSLITDINGTNQEITNYYVSRFFTLDEMKPMVKAVSVEFI